MGIFSVITVNDFVLEKFNQLLESVFPGWTSFLTGAATTGTKKGGFVSPCNFTLLRVQIYSDVAPVGADLIIDVNKNDVTMFTTQANRPKVVAGSYAGTDAFPDITSILKGDRIDFDIDQVGSTTAGGNPLRVAIVMGTS